jgi:hypothetical protein
MALEHGHDCVVLSALGCGAYGSLWPSWWATWLILLSGCLYWCFVIFELNR